MPHVRLNPRQCLLHAAASPRPRAQRPRSTCLRYASTKATASQSRSSRLPWRYAWYILSVGLGAGIGVMLRAELASRFDPPIPDSDDDVRALRDLAQAWDRLEIVKGLRAQTYNLHSDVPLKRPTGGKGGWVELDIRRNMAEHAPDRSRDTRNLTQKALSGLRALGIQRAFWNSQTGEIVAIIWIGPSLSGWPGVAHGGGIITIFEDAMSRMIAGPNASIDSIPTPISMSVEYARPTLSGNTFILRASFSKPDLPQEVPPLEPVPAKSWLPSWKDFTKKPTSAGSEATVEISGTLEDLYGQVKVRAKGAWPISAVTQKKV